MNHLDLLGVGGTVPRKTKSPRVHDRKREGIEIRAVVLADSGSTRNVRSRPTASVGAGDYFQD